MGGCTSVVVVKERSDISDPKTNKKLKVVGRETKLSYLVRLIKNHKALYVGATKGPDVLKRFKADPDEVHAYCVEFYFVKVSDMKDIETSLIEKCRSINLMTYNRISSGVKHEEGYVYVITEVVHKIQKNGVNYTLHNIRSTSWCCIL